MRGLVVDLFAGGGGASAGIEAALGRPVDIAINHDPVALAVHKANHPHTLHLEADIWEVRPREATGGRPVDLLWASPDCTHFSVAKGDVPRRQDIRSLAWAVVRWAREVRPRVIALENVQEFRGWGPLGPDGKPDRARMGQTFKRWKSTLEGLGYTVDYRVLDASLYGAPTRRRRLFLVARCDGQAIRWPEPTHGPGRLPVRTAAECIDWSLLCPSIFERKRPLAQKTLWRIAQGIRRFVLESPRPFIVRTDHHQSHATNASVVKNRHALIAPTLVQTGYGERPGQAPRALDLHKPLGTIIAGGSGGNGKHALVGAFLAKHFGGVYSTDGRAGKGQRLDEPARTITAKARLGLVTVEGVDYQIVDIGMRMLEPHELLRAQFGRFAAGYNLSAARGRSGKETKAAKVRLIGNSVCPEVAEALIQANTRLSPRRAESGRQATTAGRGRDPTPGYGGGLSASDRGKIRDLAEPSRQHRAEGILGVTSIEWTDVSWNCVRGCSRVSEGCRNCYAERMAARFSGAGQPFDGFASPVAGLWTGRVKLIPEKLDEPLRWRKPRRVFVNSMSDLFHEALRRDEIDRVFAVMALAPRHTFQILTKRPERMRDYCADPGRFSAVADVVAKELRSPEQSMALSWPLPNVWLGVSCEDQQRADERIPLLLETPAAVRFVSLEPLLGPIEMGAWLGPVHPHAVLGWVIVGGESGPGARPLDVAWIRSIVRRCREASVPCFVKQLGAKPYSDHRTRPPGEESYWADTLRHPKGGDPAEWPEDLRVREFPA